MTSTRWLAHNKAQSHEYNRLNILSVRQIGQNIRIFEQFLSLLERSSYIVWNLICRHIVAKLILRCQNDISQLGEVLNHDIRLVQFVIEQSAILVFHHGIILEKLSQKGI